MKTKKNKDLFASSLAILLMGGHQSIHAMADPAFRYDLEKEEVFQGSNYSFTSKDDFKGSTLGIKPTDNKTFDSSAKNKLRHNPYTQGIWARIFGGTGLK